VSDRRPAGQRSTETDGDGARPEPCGQLAARLFHAVAASIALGLGPYSVGRTASCCHLVPVSLFALAWHRSKAESWFVAI
jgi:hypothetical protein